MQAGRRSRSRRPGRREVVRCPPPAWPRPTRAKPRHMVVSATEPLRQVMLASPARSPPRLAGSAAANSRRKLCKSAAKFRAKARLLACASRWPRANASFDRLAGRGRGSRGTTGPTPNTAGTRRRRAPCRAEGGPDRSQAATASSIAMPSSSASRRIGKPAEEEQRRAQSASRQGAAERRPLLLREHDQPLGQFIGSPKFAAHEVAVPQSPQRPETARPIDRAGRTAPRPGCRLRSTSGAAIALGCDQRTTDRHAEGQLLVEVFRRVGQRLDQLEPFAQVSDRFHVGRAAGGQLAGAAPVGNRPRRQARLGQMLGQHFRLGLGDLGKPLLERLGDAGVQLLAPGLEQRLVGRVLDQGVLEAVGRLGRGAAAEDQLGGDQLVEGGVELAFRTAARPRRAARGRTRGRSRRRSGPPP